MNEEASSPEEKSRFRREFLQAQPPRIRFSSAIREAKQAEAGRIDHFEFLMALMEAHPMIPFESCSFGSDLLDVRRALAYQIVLRQLGHARSLVVNANIRNRTGVGVSLRCMLEMYAFAHFFHQENRLNNYRLIEVFLLGQSFATGGWYELEKAWKESHNEPLPKEAKEFFEQMFGLPRLNKILKPVHEIDEGFSYLYSRYSEFVHPAFARPTDDFQTAIHCDQPHSFGCLEFYQQENAEGSPIDLILQDINSGSFCLEMFWPIAFDIDPHFDRELRPQIVEILRDHGFDKPS
jgi:hypothetical protein